MSDSFLLSCVVVSYSHGGAWFHCVAIPSFSIHSPLVVRERAKWKEETTSAKVLRWECVWYKEMHVAGEEQAGWGDG